MADEPKKVSHTPGPWYNCAAHDERCPCRGIIAQDGTSIACWYGNKDGCIKGVTVQCPDIDEGVANARLLAAAPTMLLALRCVQQYRKSVTEPEYPYKQYLDHLRTLGWNESRGEPSCYWLTMVEFAIEIAMNGSREKAEESSDAMLAARKSGGAA